MVRAELLLLLLSQWLEQMLPSERMGPLSSAAHAAPLLGYALQNPNAPFSNLGTCRSLCYMLSPVSPLNSTSEIHSEVHSTAQAGAPRMEGGQAGNNAGGAWFGCGYSALQRARHGPQLHAIVRDGWVGNIARTLLLLFQAHGCNASAPPAPHEHQGADPKQIFSLLQQTAYGGLFLIS